MKIYKQNINKIICYINKEIFADIYSHTIIITNFLQQTAKNPTSFIYVLYRVSNCSQEIVAETCNLSVL